jgi:hypothetical protein
LVPMRPVTPCMISPIRFSPIPIPIIGNCLVT